jgi:ATP-binding cassette subfamily B multidrug efflux pump
MIAFGWIINLVQRAAPSMNRIMDIIRTEPDISNGPNTNHSITQSDIEGEIEFRDVTFRYPLSSSNTLKNISLKIRKGTILGIIGPTGSGKSTLINLIPRIWDATSGNIYLDGNEIKTIPLEVLRKSIGIVPQESFLFSNTIGNNIAYSSDIADQIKIEEASRSSGLQKDIENFPKQYSTILGERGITLSGGQKQRASLARALYMKPKILILDDSMSAVDTKTEEEILQELKILMKGRTSIIITHRISTVMAANNIIVLSDGEIKEEGTHNELVAKKGLYYDIHQKQLLEEEISGIE